MALSKENDADAAEELLTRYSRGVRAIARSFYMCRDDTEDLIQEGMIALVKAIAAFDEKKGKFGPFARRCVRNSIIDYVKKMSFGGGTIVVPLPEDFDVVDEDPLTNPEGVMIRNENRTEFFESLKKVLSDFEYFALTAYLDGEKKTEIAQKCSKSVKSVDNAITRAHGKMNKILKNNNRGT